MRELRQHAKPVLRIICLILAGLVMYQLAGVFTRLNPFRSVTVPQLPSLVASTNTPTVGDREANPTSAANVKETNSLQRPAGTNMALVAALNTNSISTNSISPMPTSILDPATNSTAQPELAATPTNRSTNVAIKREDKMSGTNFGLRTNTLENGTNPLATATKAWPTTNQPAKTSSASLGPPVFGTNSNAHLPPGVSAGKRGGDIPPALQIRIDRIAESEILGPIMRPLPMGLLGIAGEFAFLRSATGQTGLVKEGDLLGDIKLLRIGINRVLIEQDGQKKELLIFSGTGGESLLPKPKDDSDENKHP